MSKQLRESYDVHPLTAARILARAGSLGDNSLIAEFQLAVDKATEFTDQNHVGGAENTIELGLRMRLSPRDTVLDLACGLGGSARLLATVFGCKVVGVDLHQGRIEDARRLSRAARFSERVSFVCSNVLKAPAPKGQFSAVICQAAMAHFLWKSNSLLHLQSSVLNGARLGIEDGYLRRSPNRASLFSVNRLGEIWNVKFGRVEDWRERLTSLHVGNLIETDLSEDFIAYYLKRQRLVQAGRIEIERREAEGYALAFKLADAGILGYRRWIGQFEWED